MWFHLKVGKPILTFAVTETDMKDNKVTMIGEILLALLLRTLCLTPFAVVIFL